MSFEKYGQNATMVGPWGGQEGLQWDDGVYSTIRQIEIVHGAGIDSIRIEYDDNGKSVWSEKHGGRGGAKIDKIRLAYPEEYLTSLHGHYGSLQQLGPVFVRSLTLETNKRKYGPYGVEQGTFFTCSPTHGKIVGFLGKAGWYLDAIGAYVQPIHNKAIAASTAADSFFNSQKFVAQGTEYAMIQGSLGPDYDLIVAVKHKDGKNNSLPINLAQKASHNYSDTEHKNDAVAGAVPIKIVELPSNNVKGNVTSGQGKIENVPSKNVKRVVSLGPWGGKGGTLFDDGVYDGIRQIKVKRNVGVVSIRVCYDKNGQSVWAAKNGGTGSFTCDKIAFDYPSEILTHITGYHGPTMIMGPEAIKSLTFHTTRRKFGPYGEEQGQFFSTKLKEGSMIIGFHGKKGLFVDAIGVHVLEGKVAAATPSSHNLVPVLSSMPISKKPESTSPIKSLNPDPVLSAMPKTKKPGPNSTVKSLNPDPVLSSMPNTKKSGSNSPVKYLNPDPVLSSMPNTKKSGLNSPTKPNPQTALALPKVDNSQWPFNIGKQGQNEEVGRRLVKDPAPFGSGPWGGEGGKPWDDGVFTGIKQIVLTRQDAISCIEIEYDRNGQSVWSIKHGGMGGQTSNRVKLDFPHEVLTCISGYYGPTNKNQGTKVIQSLTFHTSRKKYGPFGEEVGTYFASGTTEGKVVGFHGRSSMYLDAIGVHMQHWLGSSKLPKPSIMKYFS